MSPVGDLVAIIDADQLSVCIVPLIDREQQKPHRFTSRVLVPVHGAKRKRGEDAPQQMVPERFVATAWSADGSQLLVAGAGGALYLMDR